MPDVIIIGDGPGGLSAALLLAKNGMSVTVYGQDKTAMHFAKLKNYLGVPEMPGGEFQKIARAQAERFGASLRSERVESARLSEKEFSVKLEGGTTDEARYLVLSEGKSPKLAQELGLDYSADSGVEVDINGRTSVAGLYAVGRLARPKRSQAIISAGDGAAVAIDILSREKGVDVVDWDEL